MHDNHDDGGFDSSPPYTTHTEDLDLDTHNDIEQNDFNDFHENDSIKEECKKFFRAKDSIMEPKVIDSVQKFMKAGGPPQDFVDLLAESYSGVAQLANLLADWLIVAGASVEEVQGIVENHLKELIIKNFDPRKADSIFTGAGQPPTWIEEMIEYKPWRDMFYELAVKYPDCLMLNFTIKMISDAGYQSEVGAISSACSQLEVFSKVLKTSIPGYFQSGTNFKLDEFVKSCCHGLHTYMFTQCMLHELSENVEEPAFKAIAKCFSQDLLAAALKSGRDLWSVTLLMMGCGRYPRLFSSLFSIVAKRRLNPGDLIILYKFYASQDPPPVAFLRIPQLLDLFIELIFCPSSNIPQDHKSKYFYLLAYAASVWEEWDGDIRDSVFTDELGITMEAIESVYEVCSNDIGSSAIHLSADVAVLYQSIRFPVVSMGILKWIEVCMCEKNYAKVITEVSPLQIVMLDEICTWHQLQHENIFGLLKQLFERNYPDLDTLMELEFKKTLVDRFVHMVSCGFIKPIIVYMKDCMDRQVTDVSLLRHYVTEILEMVAPPYSADFVAGMLPIVKNNEVTDPLKDGDDDVTKFLEHCEPG